MNEKSTLLIRGGCRFQICALLTLKLVVGGALESKMYTFNTWWLSASNMCTFDPEVGGWGHLNQKCTLLIRGGCRLQICALLTLKLVVGGT